MSNPTPPLSPRALAILLALACLISLVGAAALGFDLHAGLSSGAFRLVRHPVTRETPTLFTAVAAMEAVGVALCLAVGLLEAFLMIRCLGKARRETRS